MDGMDGLGSTRQLLALHCRDGHLAKRGRGRDAKKCVKSARSSPVASGSRSRKMMTPILPTSFSFKPL